MFAYVPSPNADPVIVVGIVLVALVVLGFVLWTSFTESAGEKGKGWKRVLKGRRRKQKSGFMTASTAAGPAGGDLATRAKFKSSTILGSVDLPAPTLPPHQKPKSDFNLWMHSEGEVTKAEQKPPEGKKHDLVA